jgi:hypothetical protein
VQLPQTLSLLIQKFNRFPLTGQDFVELCRANNITVRLTAGCGRGFYYCVSGRHYITLSTELSREERVWVGWHEFAHFLQNIDARKTIAAFSAVQPNKESEKLADAFARIATQAPQIKITGPKDFLKMIMRTKL